MRWRDRDRIWEAGWWWVADHGRVDWYPDVYHHQRLYQGGPLARNRLSAELWRARA